MVTERPEAHKRGAGHATRRVARSGAAGPGRSRSGASWLSRQTSGVGPMVIRRCQRPIPGRAVSSARAPRRRWRSASPRSSRATWRPAGWAGPRPPPRAGRGRGPTGGQPGDLVVRRAAGVRDGPLVQRSTATPRREDESGPRPRGARPVLLGGARCRIAECGRMDYRGNRPAGERRHGHPSVAQPSVVCASDGRPEPGPRRGPKPGGPDVRRMTRIPPGWRRASSDQTRRFRRARTASAVRRDRSCGHSTLISPVDPEPYGATTLQGALRHSFSMVPPNSR